MRRETVRSHPRIVYFLSESSIPTHSLFPWLTVYSSPSVFVPDIGTADGLPVVVWIHGGGYGYRSHQLLRRSLTFSGQGMRQEILVCILRRTLSLTRKSMLLWSIFSIVLVLLVKFVSYAETLFAETY
jgi:hypothetical protein